LQYAVPRFTLAGCFFFIVSYIAVAIYESGANSDSVMLASDILFILGIFVGASEKVNLLA
jgi:hypothetical protein